MVLACPRGTAALDEQAAPNRPPAGRPPLARLALFDSRQTSLSCVVGDRVEEACLKRRELTKLLLSPQALSGGCSLPSRYP
jgi:hypothetical protein